MRHFLGTRHLQSWGTWIGLINLFLPELTKDAFCFFFYFAGYYDSWHLSEYLKLMLCLSHLWIEKCSVWLGCWMVWYIRQQQYHTTYSEWCLPYETLDNSFIWCMSKFSSFIGILWKTVNFYFQIISFMQRNNESLQLLKKKKKFHEMLLTLHTE